MRSQSASVLRVTKRKKMLSYGSCRVSRRCMRASPSVCPSSHGRRMLLRDIFLFLIFFYRDDRLESEQRVAYELTCQRRECVCMMCERERERDRKYEEEAERMRSSSILLKVKQRYYSIHKANYRRSRELQRASAFTAYISYSSLGDHRARCIVSLANKKKQSGQ